MHPDNINLNNNFRYQFSQSLESQLLEEKNKSTRPQALLSNLIYSNTLPELQNDINWSNQLVVSIGEDVGGFVFFEDSYVELENDWGIGSTDDMVAYLLKRDFELGIAREEKLEQILWREGIISNGNHIPKNLFFEGSAIEYLENSKEIKLSSIVLE